MSTHVSRGFIINMMVFSVLALLAIYVMNNSYWAEQTVPKPLSGEAASNPFYSEQHLADALGAHSEWKHVLTSMPSTQAIIVLSYWNWDLIADRREKLQRWVEQGGRLMLDSSLIANDSSLKQWTGLEYQNVPKRQNNDDADDTDSDDNQEEIANTDSTDDGCEHMHLIDHRPDANPDRDAVQVCDYLHDRFIVSAQPVVWGVRNAQGLQAARVNIGKGSVTLFNGMPFDNLELLKGEHGLLFAGATQLHHGDYIHFCMDERGTPLLKLVWRYGYPAVILTLCLVAAALWRNGMRFGPLVAVTDSARRSLAEQISGTGKFILRFNGGRVLHAATLRAVHDAARRHIAHYDRLGSVDRIAALASITGTDADTLIGAFNFQGTHHSSEWRRVITILEELRRHLLTIKYTDKQRRSHAS